MIKLLFIWTIFCVGFAIFVPPLRDFNHDEWTKDDELRMRQLCPTITNLGDKNERD